MRSPQGRARTVLVVAMFVVMVLSVAAAAFVVVVYGGDDDRPDSRISPTEVLSAAQLERIRGAKPDPHCDAEAPSAPGDASLVHLDVLRVVGTCLTATTEYVPPADVAARRAVLAKDPSVVVAAVMPPTFSEAGDDRRKDQWPLDRLGVPPESSEAPWPDGTGVVVAVIDTGIDANHPDLAGAVIDRRHYAGEGELDPGSHGTHVAGIIAARRDNGGIVGVASGASLLDVPVRLEGANADGPSWSVGLAWAVNHGADVANMSLGAALSLYQEPDYRDALEFGAAVVEFARNNNVVVVASAGNCGNRTAAAPVIGQGCEDRNQRQIPSAYDGVVNVGAVQQDLKLAAYSTKNDDVDLVAPGGESRSFVPPGTFESSKVLSTVPNGKYAWYEGTSMAAPHVAAAAAVGRSVSAHATGDQISQALINNADRDRVNEDDRDNPGTGHGFLDIPGMVDTLRNGSGPPRTEPAAGPADRTQAAYVRDGTLFVFDGTTSQPVRRAATPPQWMRWSADHKLLVGADSRTLFSWAGPGTQVVEKPCSWCGDKNSAPAFVENAPVTDPRSGRQTDDLVLRMDPDGTLTRYDAHTLDELGSIEPPFPPGGSKSLHGAVGGKLLIHETGGAHAAERLWLVDPASGQVGASHTVSGYVVADTATNAADDKIAVFTNYGTCGTPLNIYVLAAGTLNEIAHPQPEQNLMVDELFFNGDALYASTRKFTPGSPGFPCAAGEAAGLLRLTGPAWQQVDPDLAAGRPLEGRTGEPTTGWLTVRAGRGALEPPPNATPAAADLGPVRPPTETDRSVWSTPTHTEILLSSPN